LIHCCQEKTPPSGKKVSRFGDTRSRLPGDPGRGGRFASFLLPRPAGRNRPSKPGWKFLNGAN
ncbi:MAG: hypothetical protein LBE84_04970, partial [Planctomycetota bacterium]|nr:hypothetical protein [Planctomycetota bacterium]